MTAAADRSEPAVDRPVGLRALAGRLLRKPLFKALLAAQLVAAATIGLRSDGWLQPAELLIYDMLRVAWSAGKISDRFLLVGATEEDITAGDSKDGRRWGWPLRDGKLAELLERLAAWKPRAIGVDLYRDIPEPPGTEQLDAVLRRHPEVYWVFKLRDDAHPGIPAPQLLRNGDRAVLADTLGDPGGVVRRGLLFADDGNNQYVAMGLALALAYLAPERIGLESAGGDDVRLGKAVIRPLDAARGPYVKLDSRGYQVLLDFHGGREPFRERSLSDVMDGDDLAPLVRDRVVIVGVTAESVKDSFATPFSTGFNSAEPVNGIALHAHLADQLIREALDGRPIVDGLSRRFEDLWIWAWAMGGAMLGLMVRSTLPGLAGGAAGAGLIAAIVYVAFGRGLLLPALPAGIAWLGTSAVTNQLLYAAVIRARARLRKSFEHYLPPQVIAKMVDADALPVLGGERREISVLFTDVASFTTFSEGRDPQELSEITNQYFDGVCAAVFAQEGYVNAFLGDGVLAFFGAPQEQSDHADRAVSAALAIASFGDRFSAEQIARGVKFLHTRVGVHTGIAFVGNVGARQRLQYTALGDILNTASRLEGLNKAIGSRVCVSRQIVDKCRRHRFRPIGAFIVKGRSGATEVFAPIDAQRSPPDAVARYETAYRALEAAGDDAATQFAELYGEDPEDPCVAFHYHRLRQGERGTLIEMHEK